MSLRKFTFRVIRWVLFLSIVAPFILKEQR